MSSPTPCALGMVIECYRSLLGAGGQLYIKTIVLFSALPLVNWKALYIVHQTKLCVLFKTNNCSHA